MLSNKTVSRIIMSIVSVVIMGFMVIYFLLSSSYQDALSAKFYYLMGDFNQSFILSKDALKKDRYNKLAFTILAQSKLSLKYIDYIDEANIYLAQIGAIASQNEIEKSDRIRVKMICEIMIDKYKKLNSSRLTDSELTDRAKEIHTKFLELYEEIARGV